MKVLYYHQYFSTPAGASGTRSYALARSLVEAGHQVQIVCLTHNLTHTGLSGTFRNGRRSGFVDGIEVLEFDIPYSNHAGLLKRTLVFLRYSWQSLILALHSDADLVFATSTPLTAGIPGIVARWLRGTPFVFEVRDLWPELPRAMGVVRNPLVLASLSLLEWFSYHSADACIGLAPGICDGIAERGICPRSITSIPNACDLDLFHPLPEGKPKQPHLLNSLSLQLPADSFVAAFTGAHGLANGLDAVLDVAANLQSLCRHDIHLLFIGDGRCKPKLQGRVAREGLRNCHFLPPIPKQQLSQILRESVHVGLMVLEDVPAFYRGTSPNKFFDYLACGLPVLNNYPGWLAELIVEHQVGIAVPPRDPYAFASALIQLADQTSTLTTMGIRARQLAESHFSRHVVADKWLRVLEDTGREYALRSRGRLNRLIYSFFKYIADRTLAIVALLLLSPLLVVTAVLVKLRLGSPVLFIQKRPGYQGKTFSLLKFRTMTNECDSSGALLPDCERLTPFGCWLRTSSIDELPSLINIAKGEMSFVGPRPFIIPFSDYEPRHLSRFHVMPGLTGWAQINGRNSISWIEKFDFDCWYTEHRSFVLDLRILFRTFYAIFDKKSISSQGYATYPRYNRE